MGSSQVQAPTGQGHSRHPWSGQSPAYACFVCRQPVPCAQLGAEHTHTHIHMPQAAFRCGADAHRNGERGVCDDTSPPLLLARKCYPPPHHRVQLSSLSSTNWASAATLGRLFAPSRIYSFQFLPWLLVLERKRLTSKDRLLQTCAQRYTLHDHSSSWEPSPNPVNLEQFCPAAAPHTKNPCHPVQLCSAIGLPQANGSCANFEDLNQAKAI